MKRCCAAALLQSNERHDEQGHAADREGGALR